MDPNDRRDSSVDADR